MYVFEAVFRKLHRILSPSSINGKKSARSCLYAVRIEYSSKSYYFQNGAPSFVQCAIRGIVKKGASLKRREVTGNVERAFLEAIQLPWTLVAKKRVHKGLLGIENFLLS